jgi:hypothetical protein
MSNVCSIVIAGTALLLLLGEDNVDQQASYRIHGPGTSKNLLVAPRQSGCRTELREIYQSADLVQIRSVMPSPRHVIP